MLHVCELQYSKATSNPARWVLAVPKDSPRAVRRGARGHHRGFGARRDDQVRLGMLLPWCIECRVRLPPARFLQMLSPLKKKPSLHRALDPLPVQTAKAELSKLDTNAATLPQRSPPRCRSQGKQSPTVSPLLEDGYVALRHLRCTALHAISHGHLCRACD